MKLPCYRSVASLVPLKVKSCNISSNLDLAHYYKPSCSLSSSGEWSGGAGSVLLPPGDEREDLHCALQGHQLSPQGAPGSREGSHEEGAAELPLKYTQQSGHKDLCVYRLAR